MQSRSIQRSMMLAAVAILIAGSAMADDTCLKDADGAQCDILLDEYRADEVPVGTTNVWSNDEFLQEHPRDLPADPGVDSPAGEDVLYWDGDSATIVPEETGPQIEILDW